MTAGHPGFTVMTQPVPTQPENIHVGTFPTPS